MIASEPFRGNRAVGQILSPQQEWIHMPELPEVETIASGLNRRLAGEHIESVWLGTKPEPLKSPAAEIVAALEGARIQRVHRVGKHIVFDLSHTTAKGNPQWVIQLGMTGNLLITQPSAEIAKHTHVILRLESGRDLRFVDPRRFGRISVIGGEKEAASGFAGPGTEPLTISVDDFVKLFRGRKTPIKAALLNQKLLHGVGNIYADESLFRAGIRPRRRAGALSRAQLTALHRGLKTVLRQAIKAGGSSVSDYVDSDGEEGLFQLKHFVYMRTGKPCRKCGMPIKRIVLAGRGTHFCPTCQK
jgi:formamidopyrimidine-DNA glycosylase